MKAFAVALLGLAVTAPAMAGPYVSTKSEFKGDEEGYSKTVHQARIGYGTKLESGIKPYIEVGGGLSAKDGVEVFDGDSFTVAEVGACFPSLILFPQRQSLSTSGVKMMLVIGSLKLAPSTSSEV